MEEISEAVFSTRSDSGKTDGTTEHVTHINKATAVRGVFCSVRFEVYNED
jgi:hypothetical protein